MIIGLGADHGGFALKEHIKEYLLGKGYEIRDYGTLDGGTVDYPDIAFSLCQSFFDKEFDCGMLFCGTGIGISIAANKVPGIICAHCTDSYSAKMAKMHNNANVIALGGKITGFAVAEEIVDAYLSTEFSGGRHEKRINKFLNYKG